MVDIYFLPHFDWSKRAVKLLDSCDVQYNYYVITNDDKFNRISKKISISIYFYFSSNIYKSLIYLMVF